MKLKDKIAEKKSKEVNISDVEAYKIKLLESILKTLGGVLPDE